MVISGSSAPLGRSGRRQSLRPTERSLDVLLGALGAVVEASTGETMSLGGSPVLTAKVNKKRTRVKLRGKVPLTTEDGAPVATWVVKLKGSVAP
jgi:hypothetical protein